MFWFVHSYEWRCSHTIVWYFHYYISDQRATQSKSRPKFRHFVIWYMHQRSLVSSTALARIVRQSRYSVRSKYVSVHNSCHQVQSTILHLAIMPSSQLWIHLTSLECTTSCYSYKKLDTFKTAVKTHFLNQLLNR